MCFCQTVGAAYGAICAGSVVCFASVSSLQCTGVGLLCRCVCLCVCTLAVRLFARVLWSNVEGDVCKESCLYAVQPCTCGSHLRSAAYQFQPKAESHKGLWSLNLLLKLTDLVWAWTTVEHNFQAPCCMMHVCLYLL